MKISRRSFVKATASALLVPTVTLRPEINREALLAAFADPTSNFKYEFRTPFIHGSLTYASDNRSICRAELENPKLTDYSRHLPPVDKCWSKYWHPTRWSDFALPPVDALRHTVIDAPICPVCGNRRISYGDSYPDREWTTGPEAVRLGWDVDDNTIRDESCPACSGGQYRDGTVAIVEGVSFNAWFLRPITALPNVRVSRSRTDGICFRADGFEGLALGVPEKYVERVSPCK